MYKISCIVILIFNCISQPLFSQNKVDTSRIQDNLVLDEIVVTGSRIPVHRNILPTPVSVIHRNTIEQSEENNLLPVLAKYVPSLFVTSRGIAGYGVSNGSAGGINLRGLSGGAGRVLILIDGHPQYATIYGHPVADAYMASDVERVEVSRGAASILYGSNAMGGAINMISRKALEEGNNLSARLSGGSYGTQRYSLTDSYRKERFSGTFSGNYERTDGHRANSQFESFSGFGKFGYDISSQWKATANINLAKVNSNNPGTVTKPILDGKADVLRGMTGLSVENNYKKTSGAVNVYYNWGDHKINDGYTPGGKPRPYLFKSTDYMGGANMYQSVRLFKGNTLTGGFDFKLYGGNACRNPETEIYADNEKLDELAGYLFVEQELGQFMLNGGLRLEHHNLYGAEWVPQGGISYRVTPRTHLKLSVSKGFRTPNIRELYMYATANEDLQPEKNISYDFSIMQGLFDNRLSMELTLFYITGDNIIESVEVSPEVYQNRNIGEFTNKGFEFTLNYQMLKNLDLHTNYSYLHMDKSIAGAPKNKLYLGTNFHPGKFSLSIGMQIIDELILSTTNDEVITDSYTLVDARISYKVLKWFDVFAKGDNLLAQSYETMLGYPMPRATFLGGVILKF